MCSFGIVIHPILYSLILHFTLYVLVLHIHTHTPKGKRENNIYYKLHIVKFTFLFFFNAYLYEMNASIQY